MKPFRNSFARSRRPDKSKRVDDIIVCPSSVSIAFDCLLSDIGVSDIVVESGNEASGYTTAESNYFWAATVQAYTVFIAYEANGNYLPEGDEYKVSFNFNDVSYVRKVQLYEKVTFKFFCSLPLNITVDATNSTEDVTVDSIEVSESSSRGAGFGYGGQGLSNDIVENFYSDGQSFVGSEASAYSIASATASLGTTAAGDVTGPIALDTDGSGNWLRLKVIYTVNGCTFSETSFRASGVNGIVISPVGFGSPPSDISLSGGEVTGLISTLAGTLSATDSDANDTATFSLVAGEGSTDNGKFHVSGTSISASSNQLPVGNYSIRVRATDSEGLYFETSFSIAVILPPFSIELAGSSAVAKVSSGVFVGIMTPLLLPSELIYGSLSLCSGTGDTDNSRFAIQSVDGRLAGSISWWPLGRLTCTSISSALPNQSGPNTFSIRVALQSYGYSFEDIFSITISPAPNGGSGSYGGGSG